jgi:hypothetical protein
VPTPTPEQSYEIKRRGRPPVYVEAWLGRVADLSFFVGGPIFLVAWVAALIHRDRPRDQ